MKLGFTNGDTGSPNVEFINLAWREFGEMEQSEHLSQKIIVRDAKNGRWLLKVKSTWK